VVVIVYSGSKQRRRRKKWKGHMYMYKRAPQSKGGTRRGGCSHDPSLPLQGSLGSTLQRCKSGFFSFDVFLVMLVMVEPGVGRIRLCMYVFVGVKFSEKRVGVVM